MRPKKRFFFWLMKDRFEISVEVTGYEIRPGVFYFPAENGHKPDLATEFMEMGLVDKPLADQSLLDVQTPEVIDVLTQIESEKIQRIPQKEQQKSRFRTVKSLTVT